MLQGWLLLSIILAWKMPIVVLEQGGGIADEQQAWRYGFSTVPVHGPAQVCGRDPSAPGCVAAVFIVFFACSARIILHNHSCSCIISIACWHMPCSMGGHHLYSRHIKRLNMISEQQWLCWQTADVRQRSAYGPAVMSYAGSPMAGLGFGLPLSRLHARYFGRAIPPGAQSSFWYIVHLPHDIPNCIADARQHAHLTTVLPDWSHFGLTRPWQSF